MKGLVDSAPSSKPRQTRPRSQSAKTPSSKPAAAPSANRGHHQALIAGAGAGAGADLVVPEKAVDDTKRDLVVTLLANGTSRRQVAERVNLSEAEVFRIEEDYYTGQAQLSEHARLMKQMARLDQVLSLLHARVQTSVFDNPDADPKYFDALLKTIDQTSELMGLKKTRIQTEVRVIEERQVNIIVAYTRAVVEAIEGRLRPYLSAEGRRALDANRETWLSQAAADSADTLRATAPMEM